MAVKKKTAKKKTAKKKTAKKKTAKKKTAKKKTRSVAKKTVARAKAGSQKRPAAARFHKHTYRYFCQDNTGTAEPPSKRMKPGDTAIMKAVGTGVTLDFGTASPFQSGITLITLASGGSRSEKVGSTFGTFPYTVNCDQCPSGVVFPPEMIVP